MRNRLSQYLNEVVSLTMMALFIVALAAGQASGVASTAGTPEAVASAESFSVRHQGE